MAHWFQNEIDALVHFVQHFCIPKCVYAILALACMFYFASLNNSIDKISNGCTEASFTSMQQKKFLLTKSNTLSIFGDVLCSNRYFHSKVLSS